MSSGGETILYSEEAAAMPDWPTCRFTGEQYQQLVGTGNLGEDARAELLEGWPPPASPNAGLSI
jgi:hypothetical protein